MSTISFGPYDIAPVETGRFALDGGAMFGVVPKNLWQKSNPADAQNRIDMRMRALLLRGAGRTILIDTGVGHKESEKIRSIYDIDFREHTLEDSLRHLGVAPEDVTDVIITHLHFDHAGGCTRREGEDIALTFPNAMHYVQRRQWEWALNPSDRDRASYFPDNYQPVYDAGKMSLLEGGEELFPGLRLRVVEGHTFGQQIVRLTDGDQSLLYAGDLVPMSAHVPAPWIMGYDLQPLVTLKEKKEILGQAAGQRDIVVFEHDAGCDAALVMKGEKGFTAAQQGRLADVVRAAGK